MISKHKVFLMTVAILAITAGLTAFYFYIEGMEMEMFWSKMAAIGIIAIAVIYYITLKSVVNYYALNADNKYAYYRGADFKELASYKGSLKGCCDYLNSIKNGLYGIILDDTGRGAGKKVVRKWTPKC
jgi:hypothetical protein